MFIPLMVHDPITQQLKPLDLSEVAYESIEFAVAELDEMAVRFRFLADCLADGLGAKAQLQKCARMLHERAARLLYQSCEHQFEWQMQPGTPHSPPEHFHICKHCGAENQDDE